jgi:hypothetical protein
MSNTNLLKIIFISLCISLTVENLFCQPENIESPRAHWLRRARKLGSS